ncbi:phosphopantothenoylcysteine decarboxylase [Cajanus cajan]|uniref:phosphopantothenoylcysteine decarboxylase n=1 Tax=Cajanus cajan TaxID=3821 RepID=UPI00098D7D8B|nr:phosphopantothenoylcysteine decarboxylase [Cajanus cajan]XP_020220063.1 phosphopantothenoylcysteine decarboxylase [Cajanus cajan]
MDSSGSCSSGVKSEPQVPPKKPRVVLAACGCTAAVKFGLLCRCFLEWAEVRCIVTQSSLFFIDRATFPNDANAYHDEHEWYIWRGMDVELLEWADILVIAPLSANTLAKIAGGLCDDLLTSTVRAWNPMKKLVFAAPSMSPFTWKNPLTKEQCLCIVNLGITIIQPVKRRSGAEEYETGAMAEPSDISRYVRISYENFLQSNVGSSDSRSDFPCKN